MPRGARAAIVLVSALLSLNGCSQMDSEPVPEADLARAREALTPFKSELLAELVVGLEDGPLHAIAVCRVRAPEIAAGLGIEGVEMGRTSHRVRNPSNAPRPWMQPLLSHYLANPGDTEPRAVRLEEGRFGYVEPIYMKPQCVTCHGPAVSPSLLEEIRALYPDDAATGFVTDELRGLFWVTMPLGGENPAEPAA